MIIQQGNRVCFAHISEIKLTLLKVKVKLIESKSYRECYSFSLEESYITKAEFLFMLILTLLCKTSSTI